MVLLVKESQIKKQSFTTKFMEGVTKDMGIIPKTLIKEGRRVKREVKRGGGFGDRGIEEGLETLLKGITFEDSRFEYKFIK